MDSVIDPVEAGAKAPADKTEKKPEPAPDKAEKKAKAPADKLVYKLRHPQVQTSAKGIGIYFDGEEQQISITDGIFETDKESLKIMLMGEGWIDETVYPVAENPTTEKARIVKWHYRHPLGEVVDGAKVGVFDENGCETQVEIKKGKCFTDKVGIAAQLEQSGFILEKTE